MSKKALFSALVLLALSGLLLHYRIHSFLVPDRLHPGSVVFDATKFLAAFFNMIDLVVVSALFLRRSTAVYGYLLNGLIVIYGTVFMAHYSIAEMLAKQIPFPDILLKSTLPDIGIAWADFFVGKALYDLYMREQQTVNSK
jgi:hypothetical protein